MISEEHGKQRIKEVLKRFKEDYPLIQSNILTMSHSSALYSHLSNLQQLLTSTLDYIQHTPQIKQQYIQKPTTKHSKRQRKHIKRGKRGPYRRYTKQLKEFIVQLVNKYSFRKISQMYHIPMKNITRWYNQGVQRKAGGGRKPIDPIMEEKLLGCIQRNQIDNCNTLRTQALLMKTNHRFKASKGWIQKFLKRHNIGKNPKGIIASQIKQQLQSQQ